MMNHIDITTPSDASKEDLIRPILYKIKLHTKITILPTIIPLRKNIRI